MNKFRKLFNIRTVDLLRHKILQNNSSKLINGLNLKCPPPPNLLYMPDGTGFRSISTIKGDVTSVTCNPLYQMETKLQLTYTCKNCNTRNMEAVNNDAYNNGVVLVTCKGCSKSHIMADNLNWFDEYNEKKNIDDILAEKGESVTEISCGKNREFVINNCPGSQDTVV